MFSNDPPTGYYRDGYCRSGPEDPGNHAIAANVNSEFLDFTNSRGNNLKSAGVKPGMKWCLCTSRWKEAFDAAQRGDLSHDAVPKVYIHATHDSALENGVTMKDLNKYTADPETPNESRNRQDSSVDDKSNTSVGVRTIEGEHSPNTSGGDHKQKIGDDVR